MATSPTQRPRFALRAFGVLVLGVLVVAGAVIGYLEWLIRSGGASETGEVSATARAHAALVEQRLGSLVLWASDLAERAEPALSTGEGAPTAGPVRIPAEDEAAGGAPELDRLLRDVLDDRGLDVAVVAGPGGELAASAGADPETAEAMIGSPAAVRALGQGRSRGLWSRGDALWLVAAARVPGEGAPLGLAAVAEAVDRSLALEARSLGRGEVAFLAPAAGGGLSPVTGTLGRDATDELVPALGRAGALEDLGSSGPEGAAAVEVRLGGRSYRVRVSGLEGVRGGAQGALVTLVAADGATPLLRRIELVTGAAALAALLLGGLLALAAARGAWEPVREVEAAAELARGADYAAAGRTAVPPDLAAVFADLAEERSLQREVAEVVQGTGGAAPAGSEPPERSRGALLVAEMPRYARVGRGDEPREVSDRLGRDLTRVRRAVAGRQGRVEAALGHRVLAVFSGDDAEARALAAGAEVLALLSARENAFDEPVPPAVAVAEGEVVVGGPEGARTVAGLPVQQAESLLREASSGDLIVSDGLARALEDRLREAGVELAPRRGLLAPRPVYLFDAERAARAAEALGEGGARPGGEPAAEGGAESVELASLVPGTVLAERFELGERIAAGRTSLVFLARDRQSDARVAVKVLRRELLADPVGLEDELSDPGSDLRAVTGLAHPAVARVVDLGFASGLPYVASELAHGVSLERVLAERRFLPPPAALRLARILASGLAAIHQAGLAHGDLRPETVVLDPRGSLRIIDLGVAQLLPPPGVDPEVDRALGDPQYLAPERLRGAGPSPAADVWAAGTLLAEAFTGRSLYGAGREGSAGGRGGQGSEELSWEEIRDRVLSGPRQVPDPTELPEGLTPVLGGCLEREPEARYPDGTALAEALEPIRADVVLS